MFYTNLYAFLTNIDNKFAFSDSVIEWIVSERILVNNKKPTSTNMPLNKGDMIKIYNQTHNNFSVYEVL